MTKPRTPLQVRHVSAAIMLGYAAEIMVILQHSCLDEA